MRLGWQRLVVLLVLSVGALQVFHMSLLTLVENSGRNRLSLNLTGISMSSLRDTTFSLRQPTIKRRRSSVVDLTNMVDMVLSSSVLDSSGEYKVVNYLMQSERVMRRQSSVVYEDVTLVTQCSADRLLHISAMAEYWNGPISVAVFVTRNNLVATLITICKMRQCANNNNNNNNNNNEILRKNVSFHLVYPLSDDIELFDLKDGDFDGRATCSCEQGSGQTKVSAINYDTRDVPYPNNLLRNVARQNALTEFVFVVDVDMVPSKDLRQQFVTFAETNQLFSESSTIGLNDKSVYVVPAYELLDSAAVPADKRQLLNDVRESLARPFYVEVCAKCQKNTDYEAWEREPMSSRLETLYDVPWKDPWEPFYLARNTVPAYDQRFRQYGFNRISQVCEAHVAGYRFFVLNNGFLIHKGLKTIDSFHTRKDIDQERNRLLFRQFKLELKDKYPESSRRCY